MEIAESQDTSICTPAWAAEWDSISKIKNQNKIKQLCMRAAFIQWKKKDFRIILVKYQIKTWLKGQAWWLTPVIPALWEVNHLRLGYRDHPGPTWWNLISTKNTKISWAWWHTPVIPATQEAEAEESLEPRNRRLQWAKIVPLHSSLGKKSEG